MKIKAFLVACLATLSIVGTALAGVMPLRQSTASQAFKLGPFVDSAGAVLPALTIANTDVKLSINGGTLTSKNSGGCTYDALGYYTCTLDATDTATVGRLQIASQPATALSVYQEFQVFEEAVYDRDFAASAPGYVANAPVNAAQVGGQTASAAGTVTFPSTIASTTNITAGTITTASAVTTVSSGAISEASFATTAGSFTPLGINRQGTAQSATGTTLVIDSAAAYGDNTLTGVTAMVCGSTQGYCQSLPVASNVGSTDTLTLSGTFGVTPSGTITYKLFGTAPGSGSSGATAAEVWAYATRTVSAATNITSTGGTVPITASRVDASVGAYQSGLTPLQPTVAGRTFDVSATGEGGIDWANIGSPTTTVNLSGTTVSTSQVAASVTGAVGSVTGNVGGTVNGLTSTAQANVRTAIGLATANIDTQLSTIDTVVDAIKVKTDSLTFTVAGQVDANSESLNAQPVCGTGDSGTPWTGCP